MTAMGAIQTGARLGIKAASWYKKLKSETSKDAEQAHQNTSDYKYTRRTFGRRLSAAARSKRLVRQDQRVDRFNLRNYLAWGEGAGANYLQAIQPGLPGTEIELPCHLYDLTAVPQTRQTGATSYLRELYYPATRYDLYMSNETSGANVNWKYWISNTSAVTAVADSDPMTSTLSQDRNFVPIATTTTGYVQGSSTLNESFTLGERSFLESFNARLLFYSCRAHCTKFRISLIQLKEDVGPDQSSTLATAFWQAMNKQFSYNPIDKGNTSIVRKYCKVLKSMTFILDSPTTSDSDGQARSRQVDFSGFINRQLNYRWGRSADTVHMFAEDVQDEAQIPQNAIAAHPHPSRRVYLMIQALVPRVAPNGVNAALGTAASYDINLTVTHRNLTI